MDTTFFNPNKFKVETLDGRNFTLLEDVVCADGTILPKGASSDGASSPRYAWPLIAPFGSYWREAFMHDILYRVICLPKAECDSKFYQAMLVNPNISKADAFALYNAVHYFGTSSSSEDLAQPITVLPKHQ